MKIKATQKNRKVVVELDRKDTATISAGTARPAHSLFKLKQILVPVDFSECSKKALRYAVPFAKEFEATITLISVVYVPYHGSDFEGINLPLLEAEMRETATKQIESLAGSEIPAEVPRRTLIRVGRPFHEITEAAKELETDLIILATHGRTGLKHMLLGSTAENVMRHAKCPVLIVREQEHEFI